MAPEQAAHDDVSQVVVLLDVNPYFWGKKAAAPSSSIATPFSLFVKQVALFLNSILLLNSLNHVAVIASGAKSCGFVYDSQTVRGEVSGSKHKKQHANPTSRILKQVARFVHKDEVSLTEADESFGDHSLLSGSLSMALCYIQRFLKAGQPHPQPRILCLQGKTDTPQQYVPVMNAVFSAQRCMIPIDTCMVGSEHSAFLQQAAHLTSGIYMKPSLQEGLLQYLMVVFANDLHCRKFLQLPRPAGVDFRASCFCHKKIIDIGFICSVCLSIFCVKQTSCSTCCVIFNQNRSGPVSGQKRKHVTSS